ncbi:MAG: EI24 domain-containing protein [Campylobacteraceae bacterium]|jgi:hypothetical protein|nr:EI24 domain-containing protein [Campylobacteraceae bacterium]
MNYADIFSKSVNDFFSKKFLTLSFAPLLIALVVLSFLMFLGVNEILYVLESMSNDGAEGLEIDFPILAKILSFAVVHYILTVLIYLLGTFLVLAFSVVIGVLALGFLTPIVVKTLHAKYYSQHELHSAGTLKTLGITLFIILKFLLLSLLCIPLAFVPILNSFIFGALLFYLFYKLLVFDVISNIVDEKEIKKILNLMGMKLVLICFAFYLLALIPIIGLFLQLFFAIYLTHYFFAVLIKE